VVGTQQPVRSLVVLAVLAVLAVLVLAVVNLGAR